MGVFKADIEGGDMNLKKLLSVLLFGTLAVSLLAAATAQDDSLIRDTSAQSAAKLSDFVGSWSCGSSKTAELPDGQGQLVFTQKDDVVLSEGGTARSTGSIGLKVRTLNARWDTKISGSWAIKDSQMCATLKEVSVKPVNDDARTFEEKKGSPMKDAFPKGQERCSEVVELSRQAFAMKDAESGIITRCQRK